MSGTSRTAWSFVEKAKIGSSVQMLFTSDSTVLSERVQDSHAYLESDVIPMHVTSLRQNIAIDVEDQLMSDYFRARIISYSSRTAHFCMNSNCFTMHALLLLLLLHNLHPGLQHVYQFTLVNVVGMPVTLKAYDCKLCKGCNCWACAGTRDCWCQYSFPETPQWAKTPLPAVRQNGFKHIQLVWNTLQVCLQGEYSLPSPLSRWLPALNSVVETRWRGWVPRNALRPSNWDLTQ